jgi:hypothetical protein
MKISWQCSKIEPTTELTDQRVGAICYVGPSYGDVGDSSQSKCLTKTMLQPSCLLAPPVGRGTRADGDSAFWYSFHSDERKGLLKLALTSLAMHSFRPHDLPLLFKDTLKCALAVWQRSILV